MHEAGLWARALYPSLRTTLAAAGETAPSEGLVGRDPAHGRPAPRRRPRAVRPFLRRPRAGRVRSAARPAPTGRQAADPRGPVGPDHRGRARTAAARASPGAGSGRGARRVRRRRGDRPRVGRVPRLQAGAGRSGDAAVGPLAPAAAVGRVHRRQPRLRAARRVPDGRRDRPHRRRAAAPLRVHLRARADPVRAGHRGARDVPHVTPVHLPAGLLPPDRAGDRPRPRRGVRAVDPGDLRRRLAGRSAGRLRRPRRVRAAPPGRPLGARRGAGSTARARRRDGAGGRRGGLAGDPAAPSDLALRGRGPGRVRGGRPAGALVASLGPPEAGRVAIDLADRRRPARPMRPPTDSLLAIETRDGAPMSLAAALASIPAYWLIGRRYRRR